MKKIKEKTKLELFVMDSLSALYALSDFEEPTFFPGFPFFVKFYTVILRHNNTCYICNFNNICIGIFITFAARYCVALFAVNILLTLRLSTLC